MGTSDRCAARPTKANAQHDQLPLNDDSQDHPDQQNIYNIQHVADSHPRARSRDKRRMDTSLMTLRQIGAPELGQTGAR